MRRTTAKKHTAGTTGSTSTATHINIRISQPKQQHFQDGKKKIRGVHKDQISAKSMAKLKEGTQQGQKLHNDETGNSLLLTWDGTSGLKHKRMIGQDKTFILNLQ
jgi:hypothetical protein